jgi:hypothetical protein
MKIDVFVEKMARAAGSRGLSNSHSSALRRELGAVMSSVISVRSMDWNQRPVSWSGMPAGIREGSQGASEAQPLEIAHSKEPFLKPHRHQT